MFCLMLMKSTNEWESRGPRGEEACMLALDLWDVVIEVLHSSKNTHQAVRDHYPKGRERRPNAQRSPSTQ